MVVCSMSKKKKKAVEAGLWKEWFPDIEQHIILPAREKKRILADYDAAIRVYLAQGLEPDVIRERLKTDRLGGFYAHPAVRWYPLDPGEKLYPLGMKQGEMPMFRLSVYLKKQVVPELLQMALNFTIKRFPSFATTVKSGVFWHYLDSTKRRFSIEPEKGIPCSPIHVSSSGSQVFRLVYRQNRISIEFFHVVTDGTGGMIFLKSLAAEYLRLAEGVEIPAEADAYDVWNVEDTPDAQETANEFLHIQMYKGGSGFTEKPGLQLSGVLSKTRPCRVLHFEMPSAQLVEKAHAAGASVTAYILGMMFLSHKYATEEPEGMIQIQVPVNMRKYHPSRTTRNFSMYCFIGLNLSEITTLPEILSKIAEQLREKSAQEPMDKMMSTSVKMVNGLKPIPRFIKKPVAERLYGFLGDRLISNTLSNLGVVRMPAQEAAEIEGFDFLLGPSSINKAACAMVSFGDTAVFTITKTTVDPSFEKRMEKLLTDEGLSVTIKGSPVYEY